MVTTKLGQTLLYVPDVQAAASFYERAFGLSRTVVDPDGIYIALESGGSTLAFADAAWVASNGLRYAPIDASAPPPAIEINVFVSDVPHAYQAAIEAGATPWFPPTPQPWGQVVSYVRDPAGFLVEIASFPPTPSAAAPHVATLSGRCHCGNVSVRLQTARPVADLSARPCQCSFCRPRHLRWTSDPDGHLEVRITDEAQLGRYHVETATADFLLCRRCAAVVAAVSLGEPTRAVVNVDVLERAAELTTAEPRDFDGEDLDARLERRARSWSPATVVVGPR